MVLRSEGDRLTRVVVCTPRHEYFHIDHFEEHNIAALADRERAQQQHDQLKSILASFGCEIVDAPELSGHPNSVFTRDTSLCTPNGYIKLRMGLHTRRGEGEWMSKILESVGESCAGEIEEPGTVEGGDIILAGSIAFIGLSPRTNSEGVKQLSHMLRDMNYQIRTFTIPDQFLHLGGAMSILGPETVLCYHAVFPRDFLNGFDTIEITDDGFFSVNVICLGENEVVADRENTVVIAELGERGFTIHEVNLSEFAKGMGGPSCLILPIERK